MTRSPLARFAIPSAALLIAAAGVMECLRLGIGDLAAPQPGLWPLIVCCLIAVAAILAIVEDLRPGAEAPTSGGADQAGGGGGRLAVLALGLGGFVIAFSALGVIGAAALLVLLCLRIVARESWRLSVITAVTTAVGMWVLFGLLLGIDLPVFLSV